MFHIKVRPLRIKYNISVRIYTSHVRLGQTKDSRYRPSGVGGFASARDMSSVETELVMGSGVYPSTYIVTQ